MRSMPFIPLRLRRATRCLALAIYLGFPGVQAYALPPTISVSTPVAPLSYADVADLAVAASLVAKVDVTDVILLPPAQATGVPTGHKRVYIEGRVIGLIRGEGGLAPAISWLYDAPLDARGKIAKYRKRTVLLFARPGARAGQVQLVARDAQRDWTPELEARSKAVLSELLGPRPAPPILSIGDAFHVAGTVAGEGETQIFLKTEGGQPVSLSVISRPGESPRWSVALGEVVDEAAATPQRDTLLWYRLACGLPAELPARAVRTLPAQDAEAARRDYAVVIAALGDCGRTRASGSVPVAGSNAD